MARGCSKISFACSGGTAQLGRAAVGQHGAQGALGRRQRLARGAPWATIQ